MNISSASQCGSSGCESGWTSYLDQSSLSKNQCFGGFFDDEEEGLSMVSDASSGPPHCCEEEDEECFDHSTSKSKIKKKSREYGRKSQHHSFLDDTASSHVLDTKVVKNEGSMDHVLEFSQGFSATHFKGKSALKKQFKFFHSSLAEKSVSQEPSGFQGRKWK